MNREARAHNRGYLLTADNGAISASSSSHLQLSLECEAVWMRVSTFMPEAVVLKGGLLTPSQREVLPQVEEFKYLIFFFKRRG